jgi:transcriptional regulator with PAS, ATPase and Fis domain
MDYKTEQDLIWDALDDAFPDADTSTVYNTDLNAQLETLERGCIQNALDTVGGNQTKAADMLNIGRTCLIAKMKKYNIT